MATREAVLEALARVPGPDGRAPLPASGALSEVVVTGGRASFAIAIDPARAVELEPMRAAAEAAARSVRGITAVSATLTSERGAGPAPERPVGPRARAARARVGVPGVERIVAVASGKGGVGKSTTAVNLAVALARQGLRVGLLDADIYGPSVPRLLGLAGRPDTAADGRTMLPMRAHGLKAISIGMLVDEEAPMIWRGPMVMGAVTQLLREVAWAPLDLLLVDMPPGTGDAQLTLSQNAALDGAVIVSTPQDLALIDARRAVAMFRQVSVPVLGIVENMSQFACPACGAVSPIFGHGGARADAERLGVPFLGEVPLHMAIREQSDAGAPVAASDPEGPHARAYAAIARGVLAGLEGAGREGPRIVVE